MKVPRKLRAVATIVPVAWSRRLSFRFCGLGDSNQRRAGIVNKRDCEAAEKYWSPNYIQHSAHIPPGREGLLNLIRGVPANMRYERASSLPTATM